MRSIPHRCSGGTEETLGGGEAELSATGTRPRQPAAPWHCLYFLPDPHGQGALRGVSLVPVMVADLAALALPLSLAEESRLGAL